MHACIYYYRSAYSSCSRMQIFFNYAFARHFCFTLLTDLLASRGDAQAGFATSRMLGLGFAIDFGFIMTLNTVARDLSK